MSDKTKGSAGRGMASREERLAAALRVNLRRRKAQAQARVEDPPADAAPDPPDTPHRPRNSP